MAYVSPPSEPIAVIGTSCRYPGRATAPSRLWEVLLDPPDLSKKTPATRFNVDGFYHPNGEYHGTTNAPRAYWLDEDVRVFDAAFFNINPKEAETIDPQGKFLLEVVYEGMESAGLTLQGCAGKKVGVFVGLMTADYELLTAKDEVAASQYCVTGTSRSLISNRVSYFYNWNGPSMTIDTACSSSLVALHQAVHSLRSRESSMACVAGVNLMLSPDAFTIESNLHMLSPDGKSKMWDTSADGYARGEGVGVFFLKPLSQALAAGDRVDCIVRETGVNSDGRTKGITMPSPVAQSALIRNTYVRSGLDPRNPAHRCQYFEAHGTGTQAGDPREAEAIHTTFFGSLKSQDARHPDQDSDDDDGHLVVGSIKTVIGHTEGAAGVAGLLKATLALQHRLIPPNKHFHNVNPSIAPFTRRLRIPTTPTPWPAASLGQPLRASVNSFGFGGTNAHAILERYEPEIHGEGLKTHLPKTPPCPAMPLLLSATSDRTLAKMVQNCLNYLKKTPQVNLGALTATLGCRRSALPHKIAFVAKDVDGLVAKMEKAVEVYTPPSDMGVRSKPGERSRILGIFTGQGAQWPRMGSTLIASSPCFRNTLQALDEVLKKCPDPPSWSIVEELLAPSAQSRLSEAAIAQPLCTALQIALVDLLSRSSVRLSAVVGHSSGEIGAAYASGTLTARDAILIAYYRGFHAHLAGDSEGGRGGMMAVGMGVDEALDFFNQEELCRRVVVAASNAPASVTLSGDIEAIKQAKAILDQDKKFCRLLKVDTAYHSHHMDRCAGPYLASLRACSIKCEPSPGDASSCTWISSVYGMTGTPTIKELAGRYWRDNMVQPVLFSEALTRALAENGPFDQVLEIGPHPALKGPATQTMQERTANTIPYAGVLSREMDDVSAFSDALGMTWCHLGAAAVDFTGYSEALDVPFDSWPTVKDLPTYPWDHAQVHFRQPRLMTQYLHRPAAPHELLGIRTSDETASEYRWRNILKPTTLPWLKHHRFQGRIIVPAAAYCVMALDAARAMVAGIVRKPARTVEIRDLVIRTGITMEDDTQGVETLFAMWHDTPRSDDETMSARFTLDWTSMAGNRPTKQAVSGQVVVDVSTSSSRSLPCRQSQSHGTKLNKVDLDEFYSSINDIGLEYTGPFRALLSLQRRMNLATAQLEKSHPEDTSGLSVRPALLDACFQAAFAAFAAPNDGALWTSFLPQAIGRLLFNISACEVQPGETSRIDVEAAVTQFEAPSADAQARFSGDVVIYNAQGIAEVQIEGLTVHSFIPTTEADDRELYLQTVYRRDCWTGFGELPPREDDAAGVDTDLAELCERICSPGPIGDREEELSDLVLSSPYRKHLELLQACTKSLPALVGGLKQEICEESVEMATSLRHLTNVVEHISHRHPQIRVLEIDLGHAISMTEGILAGLATHYLSFTYGHLQGQPPSPMAKQMPESQAHRFSTLEIDREHPFETLRNVEDVFDLLVISEADDLDGLISSSERASVLRGLLKPGGFLVTVDTRGYLLQDRLLSFLRRPIAKDGKLKTAQAAKAPGADPMRDVSFTLPLHTFSSPRRGIRLSVRQATTAEVEVLRRPLLHVPSVGISGKVLIVGGSRPETRAIRQRLEVVLSESACTVTSVTFLSGIEDHDFDGLESAIILSDLDEPIFNALSANKLAKLQGIFAPNRYVLWLTNGFRDQTPYHAASVGLARTLKGETPQLRLQFLDLDTLSDVQDLVAQTFLRLAFMSKNEVDSMLCTTESEIVLAEGDILLPRIFPIPELNARLNSIRRVITKEADAQASAVELIPLDERGSITYHAKDGGLEPRTLLQIADEDSVVVKMLYSSAWALDMVPGKAHMFIGVGVDSEGTRVLLATPRNSSWVSVPRRWTRGIDDEHAAPDDVIAGLMVRAIVAHRLTESGDPSPLAILEADAAFVSAMEVVRSNSQQHRNVFYLTTSQDRSEENGSFIFIHPQSTRRVANTAIPSKPGALIDFTVGSTSPIAEILSCGTRVHPELSLVRCRGRAEEEGQGLDSAIEVMLRSTHEQVKKLVSSAQPQLAYVTRATVRAVADVVGDGRQPYFTVFDWTGTTKTSVLLERIRPIDLTTLLSPEKTYVLVGLTGDLGESLCRLMASHGARHFVVASRSPAKAETWASELIATGASVRLMSLDVSDLDAVKGLQLELETSLPPVAGVVNGAMVLSDGLFADMTLESLQKVLVPKVTGSQNLSQVFCGAHLDFFIMFSSLTCIGGNSGQSNYTAANLFMAGLAGQRRKQGLPGSVLDIGVLYGIGYVNRVEGAEIYQNLRRQGYMPISEQDIHHMFAEAIVAGRPSSGTVSQISTGLHRWDAATDIPLPWHTDPRFSHHTAEKGNTASPMMLSSTGSATTVRDHLRSSQTTDDITATLEGAFTAKLESMLQLPAGNINAELPIIDLGVDSLAAVEIRSWFLKEVEKDMPVLKVLGGASIRALCAELAVEISEQRLSLDKTSEENEQDSEMDYSGTSPSASEQSLRLNSSTDLSSEDDGEPEFEEVALMSFSQAKMWFPFLLLQDQTTYNCTTSYRLHGPLDVTRYEAALHAVVRKHQAFRSCFYTDPWTGEGMQAVATASPFQLKKVLNANEDSDVAKETTLVAEHVYDLENGDVFIAALLCHDASHHTIVFGYHHIILDGVSWQTFLQEVERFYVNPKRSQYQHQGTDFVDFAIKQRAELDTTAQWKKRDFWKSSFADPPSPIPLFPFAKSSSRKTLRRYEATEYFIEMDQALVGRIKDVATTNKSTPFHFYLAALQAMLHRLLHIDDLCIGITDANRSDAAFMETIGLMLDSLPLRFSLTGAGMRPFRDVLQETRNTVYGALGNSGVPLDVILSDAAIPMSATHLPLFQVLVNYRMGAIKQKSVGADIELDFLEYRDARHPFDFILTIDEEGGRGGLTLSMQDYLYDSAAASVFLQSYIHLLNEFSLAPEVQVSQPSAIPPSLERDAVRLGTGEELSISSLSSSAQPAPTTLLAMIEAMAGKFPNEAAIRDGALVHTYHEMMESVNRIASALLKIGAVQETRVGVFGGPSAGAVLALLGILKAGAVYVPLDDRNSDERLTSVIVEASVGVVMVCSNDKVTEKRVSTLVADTNAGSAVTVMRIPTILATTQAVAFSDQSSPGHLAMIMFTSGSTGKPKGIMLTHDNFFVHVMAATHRMQLGRETVLQQSALGYDAALAQIFYALANGGTLVISSNRREMSQLADLISRERISLTLMSPSEYLALFEYGGDSLKSCTAWRIAMVGGEAFPPRLRLSFRSLGLEELDVVNAYGPTEISVASNIGIVNYRNPAQDDETSVPMGPVLPGYSICLLDQTDKPVPLGYPGQIAVGGKAVSAGYLNNDELTQKSFLPCERVAFRLALDSLDAADRWYLTGDVGRMGADGSLSYLGRIDQDSQIKLRGIRIELNEISEAILEASRAVVSHAVLVVRGESGAEFLVAYVVLAQGQKPRDVHQYLARLLAELPLPVYMRPARAVPLKELPMNASGKLDVKLLSQLPLPGTSALTVGNSSPAGLSPIETRLTDVWRTVLGDTGIAITSESNFFSAGGNSLLLLRLQGEIRKSFGTDISLAELFRISDLRSMARRLQVCPSSESDETAPSSSASSVADPIDWAVETEIPDSLLLTSPNTQQSLEAARPGTGLSVLLTGATGFLGLAIARMLQARPEVEQLHCIAVRDVHSAAARTLQRTCPKAVLYSGDLAQPRLGLGTDEARLLFADASAVVHNGADVSFLKPYQALRNVNVGSSRELVRLCVESGRRVPMHFVSTAGVAAVLGETDVDTLEVTATSLEAHPPPHNSDTVDGYVASKWASEVLLEKAAERLNLPVCIYRPSSITGAGAPALDIMHNVLRFSQQMRAVPDMSGWRGHFDFVSVETVAKEIAKGAVSMAGQLEHKGVRFVHLSGEQVIPVNEARAYLEQATGYRFRELSMDAWLREAEQSGLPTLVAAYLMTTTGASSKLPSFPRLQSSLLKIAE